MTYSVCATPVFAFAPARRSSGLSASVGRKKESSFSEEKEAKRLYPQARPARTRRDPREFLLVLCHGIGGDARQVEPLAGALNSAAPHAVAFLPDAPQRLRRFLLPLHGRQWFPLSKPRESQFLPCQTAAHALNARVDKELAARGLSPSQLVLGGFSQGAMVALMAGLMRPVAPRGIIAIAGALMAAEGKFAPISRPPVLLVHGDEDTIVPCARSEEAERRLRGAGLYVHLAILPGRDHAILAHAAPVAADFLAEVCA
jgi:phospholipase/carboxylesterase